MLMAVPTMYNYLLAAIDGLPAEQQGAARQAAAALRLAVSGSAACPLSILQVGHRGSRVLGRRRARVQGGGLRVGVSACSPSCRWNGDSLIGCHCPRSRADGVSYGG